jgi:hypothetical protein
MTYIHNGQDQDDEPVVPAEDVPTGHFGNPRPGLPAHITPCTPEEQAAHLASLSAALSKFTVGAAIHRHRTASKDTAHGS